MTDNIAKITKILLWVLIALSAFFALMLFLNTNETDTIWVDNALTYAEIILVVSICAAVLSVLYIFIMKLKARPKKALISIIPIVILIMIVLFAYASSSDQVLTMPTYEGPDNVPETVKKTGAGIIVMYALIGLAIASIVFVEISKLLKK